jgi:DNA-binding transcriptional regulator PaaX
MGQLGIDAPAVRSAISSLKRRGLPAARKVDGMAGYGLSKQAREVLDEGDQRIFGRCRAELSDSGRIPRTARRNGSISSSLRSLAPQWAGRNKGN